MTTIRIDSCPICQGNRLIHRLSQTNNISNKTFDLLLCSDCGLVMTQHAPHDSDMQAFYPCAEDACYQKPQEWYDKWMMHLINRFTKEQIKTVVQEAERKSGVLLEMGCKQGYFANALRNNGWIAHAVENDDTAREYANERFLLQAEKQELLFNIKPRSYNVVVAWDTLGECYDLHTTLDKLSQLIVSDGTLIIGFHNAASRSAQRYGHNWSGWDAPRKRWHLTPGAFEALVQQHGLNIVGKHNSLLRSFMTALTSNQRSSCKSTTLASILGTLMQVIGKKDDDTYYIYTLRHK